ELIGNRRGRHSLPGRKRAADRRLNVGRVQPGRAAIGDVVASRSVCPLERHRLSVDGDAEFQISERRGRGREHQRRGQRPRTCLEPHRKPPTSARTRCSNSASGIDRRVGSPPTARAALLDAGKTGGGLTDQLDPSAFGTSRNTPWLRPKTYGTLGPCAPRKTTTRWSTENSGAPTKMRR